MGQTLPTLQPGAHSPCREGREGLPAPWADLLLQLSRQSHPWLQPSFLRTSLRPRPLGTPTQSHTVLGLHSTQYMLLSWGP